MAARGARSRKVLDKTIEKQERKVSSVHDLTGGVSHKKSRGQTENWSIPAHTRTSSLSRMGVRHNTAGPQSVTSRQSRPSSPSARSTISSASGSLAAASSKYAGKRKETAHPRGRGGGVPVKPPATAPSVMGSERVHSRAARADPAASEYGHGPSSGKKAPEMMVWTGLGNPPIPYEGMENDTDLWLETGDCLIYFTNKNSGETPRAAMRLHVQELERAGSTFLSNLVKYSEVERGEGALSPSHSPGAGMASGPFRHPLTHTNLGRHTNRVERIDEHPREVLPVPSRHDGRFVRCSTGSLRQTRPFQQPSPPMSNRMSDKDSFGGMSTVLDETEVTHEIWFPCPPYIKTAEAQRRHNLATRNFFALLYNKPVVGADFYEMVHDLQAIIDTFYELDNNGNTKLGALVIARYLSERRLDDVRGNLNAALGLLAWSEHDIVRWQQGYLEAFVHCAGMMGPTVADSMQFKRLSTVTRLNLANATNALRLRVLDAEDKLAAFDLSDMWPTPRGQGDHPVKRAFFHFADYLLEFYRDRLGTWPPPSYCKWHWLTRGLVRRLQEDLGALYDLWVNREVYWAERDDPYDRRPHMVAKRPLPEALKVDRPDLPLTEMLVDFDARHNFAHIPAPYPLLPASGNGGKNGGRGDKADSKRGGLFRGLKKVRSSPATRGAKEQLQMAVAFSEATNIEKLGVSFNAIGLIDQVQSYERDFPLTGVSAQDARLGRWILLYGLLQVLSTLSVDTMGLRYKEGVDYFVSPSLKKCPPWGSSTRSTMTEATQQDSYCWRAPERWSRRPSYEHAVADEKKRAAAAHSRKTSGGSDPTKGMGDDVDPSGRDTPQQHHHPEQPAFTEEEFPDQVHSNSARRADEQMRQAFEHMYVDKVKYMNMEKSQLAAARQNGGQPRRQQQYQPQHDQEQDDQEEQQQQQQYPHQHQRRHYDQQQQEHREQQYIRHDSQQQQQQQPRVPPRSPLRAPAAIPEVPEREQGAYFAGRSAADKGVVGRGVTAY